MIKFIVLGIIFYIAITCRRADKKRYAEELKWKKINEKPEKPV